ncbi:sugar ABC transporter permease [Acrocarpospora pleiomorpha]|uniref:Sugar ABC transporter permease n=1 Tax=Acrocarpospora pleiomorpha TaxID=90975 RepID=A0A5M3XPJ5_9ACTN|nr:sugar ABC transporter permease [Acrocarpospora pleiomorpha]GES21571.1 sugar ABC transporter permease [Acrocarpospora pleiomorpha]
MSTIVTTRRPGERRSAGGPAPATPRRRIHAGPVLLYVPALVLVVAVSIVPVGYAVWLSVHVTRALRAGAFNGLEHYGVVLGAGGLPDIIRTFVYVGGSLLITLPLGVGLAVLLNKPVAYRRAFRVIILLPWVVSQTIAALLWKWLLNPSYGPLQSILGGHDVLADPYASMAALILVNVWISYPLATILSLAAMQTVPGQVLEAARVDGCGPIQSFRRIVLPTIKPVLMILIIMLTLLYFNMVTLVYTLTGGGPLSGTQVLSLQAFLQSFQFFKIGLGAAYSVVLFGFNVIFGIAYIRVLRSDNG